jgi:hypothetical protein
MEPTSYDHAIQATTATHTRKRMEEEWDKKRTSWFIRKGFLRGVTMNMRDALDEQYYLQLKNINTAYRNTTPIQILEHLDTRWCPLDVRARRLLKAEFHADWDSTVMHLTAFGMKPTKNKRTSTDSGLSSATKTNSNSTWSKSTRQTVSTKRKW